MGFFIAYLIGIKSRYKGLMIVLVYLLYLNSKCVLSIIQVVCLLTENMYLMFYHIFHKSDHELHCFTT